MSMNITSQRPAPTRAERFPLPVTLAVFLLPLAVAGVAGWFFGLAWGIAVLAVTLWSDMLLRLAGTNFRGLRKKDKVMAPLVEKTFSCHETDPELGWTLKPATHCINAFAIPRKKLRLEYAVTTDDKGRRVTGTGSENAPTAENGISFYGCSNTFGWGLDDEATYPWLVAKARPGCSVRNYGVSGYSLYQILLTMEKTIEQDHPAVAVLGFSPGLEARSVSDHHYLRIVGEQGGTPPSCLSVAKKNGKRILKRFGTEAYKRLPLSGRSPLVKLAERLLNRLRYGGRGKNDARRKTTEHLLLSMENLCRKHGTVFHVQYLVANTGYRDFLHQTGMNWAPGPVDLDQCDERGGYLYRLAPFDGHPNAEANAAYAKTLGPVLTELLSSGKYRPAPGQMGTTERDEATESAIYPVF
ncbi:hypothetical protein GM415_11115 [Pseudodesulfovibrio cashew]|uniref:SGNH/GDSL hydrolase family protein n=1 Tax=Pseudodesulfovibrio cashew TaxID=2678688 RepID=A0A6I6JHJ7_9BACT|nr:hypothetical protein [Pseudodesulfovibrio cashew]QGY40649.1 hypothetical protein GM415_11115 [Pseudodesulfovibrio cashew]